SIAEALRSIKALDPELQWRTLGAICSGAHHKRIGADGVTKTRFVTQQSPIGDDSPDMVGMRESALYKAKVFVRRRLCEVRDNYVDRSPALSRSLGKAWNRMFGNNGTQE
ncbi:MAG TPA: hypothetical protein VJ063_16020, partial [Verrucomicrobiae bacterium]|nr:hypothetical protein [Verrucomicrobiae bacterium]